MASRFSHILVWGMAPGNLPFGSFRVTEYRVSTERSRLLKV
jgi:hypothetical protein